MTHNLVGQEGRNTSKNYLHRGNTVDQRSYYGLPVVEKPRILSNRN
jgi:hypothetical protein